VFLDREIDRFKAENATPHAFERERDERRNDEVSGCS
jgi:hypothetical protein